MSTSILVIGGVALGPKAACRCRRLMPDADITLIDENINISYGGCGIPYFVSGEVNNIDDLRATPYHTVRDPEFFKQIKEINVINQTRALSINRQAKTVRVKNVLSGEEKDLSYDKLVLATGARPRILPIPGKDLPGVYTLTRLEAASTIRKECEGGKIDHAVIVGGGFIGLETAVALADMWGVECTVVEMMDQILPGALSAPMSLMARKDLESKGVTVLTGEKVQSLSGTNRVSSVKTDKREIDAQLVIFSAGFIPNSELAREAGLDVAANGGIAVNKYMQTSDPAIYSGGDCIALTNLITGKPAYYPLGSMANRQGRVIGTNLAGGQATFAGGVGSWAVKLFELSFCGAGLTVEKARAEGFEAEGVLIDQLDRAHFYPEKSMMTMELVVDRKTRRVLGVQGASPLPDAIKARVDAVATVLQTGKPTVEDISNLEVAYSPPFASAMDIVNALGNVAENVIEGRMKAQSAIDFIDLWENRDNNGVFFIDARPAAAGKALEARYPGQWHSIPLEEIRSRLDEIPRDRQVALICNTGLRSYDCELILRQHGINNVINTMGGMQQAMKIGFKP